MKRSSLAACAVLVTFGAQAKPDCTTKGGLSPEAVRGGVCGFDAKSRAFKGSPADQARCLTRAVKPGGTLGDETIPPSLAQLVGTAAPTLSVIKRFLDNQGLESIQVGGAVDHPITADYFIIHDTSSPNCSERGMNPALCPELGKFPSNRDEAIWPENANFSGHPRSAPNRLAHVFINRVGTSVTEVDLNTPFATTKFEQCQDPDRKSGLFVGIENIQPRIGSPAIVPVGHQPNDRLGPTPGFSPPQYERLALIYVIASARRGRWLIPAFHAVLDQQFRDGHDDPQNFDISQFAAAVDRQVQALSIKQ